MRLADALRIRSSSTVALIGAGGKSTAIRTLGKELRSELPIVVTTTTKLARTQSDLADRHHILEDEGHLSGLEIGLGAAQSLLVTNDQIIGESKWQGLNENQMESLRRACAEAKALLLIEADGARGKPLKAAAQHEPVIPKWADLVVPIVGLDAIGKPFTSEYCHRAQRARELLAVQDDANISWKHMARLLLSEKAGLKGIPATAMVRGLLNKARSATDIEHGRAIAQELLNSYRYQSVILADLGADQTIKESAVRIAGIILAAGSSRRLEGPKQLMVFRGKPLVAHAVEAAQDGGLEPILVVVGEEEERMRAALQGYPVQIVLNSNHHMGQSSSVHVGLSELDSGVEGVMFLLADMPLVTADLVIKLRERHRQTLAAIVVPFANGKRGNPVLFDRVTFDELAKVVGDHGGRSLFKKFDRERVQWDEAIHFDVDTAEDLKRLRELE